jgi:CRP-like cAMP-binding protein
VVGPAAVNAEDLAALEFFEGCPVDSLGPIAVQLRPLTAAPGHVLMRQGEQAVSFLLIGSGHLEVAHHDPDGDVHVELGPGMIVGELALLRDAPRTATVAAIDDVSGWVGGREAVATMLEVPCMLDKLLRTARQRLATYLRPIPVRLRDRTELDLRPVLPGDNARIVHGPVKLSADSLYRRFQTTHIPTASLMSYLFEVDYVHHFVWVLTDGVEGPVVADARFVRDESVAGTAEIAFTVGDAYQGRGIGTLLMEALAVAARAGGISHFTARVLSDNYPMRAILDRYGAQWHHDGQGVVTARLDVPAPRDLSFSPKLYRQIRSMASHVMRVVG